VVIVRTYLLVVPAAEAPSAGYQGPANAAQVASSQLGPGAQVCAEQYASYQVRAEGLANKPLHFRVFRNGFAIQSYPGSTAFASELRRSWGNFPGPGFYKVCAVNNTSTNNWASVSIRTDSEI
jgi:hypothetical protein